MNTIHVCPECGGEIDRAAPAGLCPKCLYQAAIVSGARTSDERSSASPAGLAVPSVTQLAPLFPQLELLELIGQGGMGAVYRARQKGLGRLVAVKILPAEVGRDPNFAERFIQEAHALARLNHPNIVAVHDVGRAGDLLYYVMEYVDGVNLREAMKAGAMTPQEALAIVPQICDALQYAHDESIVHRDIKPENILLDKKGRVKIADFGLAKLLDQEAGASLTRTYQVMGTPRYMAPEQLERSRDVDHRADIYSLGVVFYELLTGELPIGRFAPPSQKVQIDVRLDEVVFRALEKEPARRYQQASEVKTSVELIRGTVSGKVSSPTASWEEKWRATPKFVRGCIEFVLAIGYLVALMMVFSYAGGKTTNEAGEPQVWMNVGRPDPWLTMEASRMGFKWQGHLRIWTLLTAFAGICLLAIGRRLEKAEKGRAHSMYWHYVIWSFMLAVVIVMGGVQHYFGIR